MLAKSYVAMIDVKVKCHRTYVAWPASLKAWLRRCAGQGTAVRLSQFQDPVDPIPCLGLRFGWLESRLPVAAGSGGRLSLRHRRDQGILASRERKCHL